MKPNRVKDCLDNARSALLLTEVLADKERQEQIADTVEQYPITKEHQAFVEEILEEKRAEGSAVLLKPQTSPGQYVTKTNGRGQVIVSRKEKEWSYNGIDI